MTPSPHKPADPTTTGKRTRSARPRRTGATHPHSWDPADYAANATAQHAWAAELIAHLQLRGHEHILDVGCGDGRITADLARSVPRGEVVGIDSSPEMIRHARATWLHDAHPNLRFEVMDARSIRLPRPVDVVFSNAALHWVDDHSAFLRGASQALRSGGRLMVSCGGKGNAADVFQALRAVLRDPRWRSGFKGMAQPYHFHGPADYTGWLTEAGLVPGQVQLRPKDMVQPHRIAFAGWVRTTWLPYTSRVPSVLREVFIQSVVDRYLARHPVDPQGKVHVRMVRLEIQATKP